MLTRLFTGAAALALGITFSAAFGYAQHSGGPRTTTTCSAAAKHPHHIIRCGQEQPDLPAADDASCVEATKQASALTAWIIGRTRWTAHEVPPIRLVSSAQLKQMYSGGIPTDLVIGAAYSDRDHVIYLSEHWRPNNLRDRSALLHELVHHLQYLNGVKATCPHEYEWQAYHLQVDWLREQGVEDPLEFLGISPMFIYSLSACPEY